jgi:hypothetical protein
VRTPATVGLLAAAAAGVEVYIKALGTCVVDDRARAVPADDGSGAGRAASPRFDNAASSSSSSGGGGTGAGSPRSGPSPHPDTAFVEGMIAVHDHAAEILAHGIVEDTTTTTAVAVADPRIGKTVFEAAVKVLPLPPLQYSTIQSL